jgi:hypothetical protein
MVVPKYLDRLLAKRAYDAQETQVPVAAARADNLMSPVGKLHRTRGRFGSEAADSVIVVPGPVARLAVVLAGALACFSVGWLAARSLPTRRGADAKARMRAALFR